MEQRRHLAERQAELFVELHGRRDRVRAELHRRGAERIRGLERMAALDAAVTASTLADVNIEAANDRDDRRQILLILRSDMGLVRARATVRTGGWYRDVMRLVHHRRRRSSIGSVGFCSARRLTRLLCQSLRQSTSQTR